MTIYSGRFAGITPTAGVVTLLYGPAPNDVTIACDINVCNRNASPALIRMFRGMGNSHVVETDTFVWDDKATKRGGARGIVLSPGERLWVYSSVSDTTFIMQGCVEKLHAAGV